MLHSGLGLIPVAIRQQGNHAEPWLSGSTLSLDFLSGTHVIQGLPAGNFLDCTRATSGQATRPDGTLQQFGPDGPRMTGRGLLVEGARTNALSHSCFSGTGPHYPDGWNQFGSGVPVTTLEPGPVAGLDCRYVSLRKDSRPGQHGLYSPVTLDPASTYSASIYARIPDGDIAGDITVDVAGSTMVLVPATALTGDWKRFTLQLVTGGASGDFALYPDGGAAGSGADLALPQLEKGGFASSYIRTEGGTATRAADRTVLANMDWLTQGTGTLLCETVPLAASGIVFELNDGAPPRAPSRMTSIFSGVRQPRLQLANADTYVFDAANFSPSINAGDVMKQAITWQDNDMIACVDGILSAHDTAASIPMDLAAMVLGNGAWGTGAYQYSGLVTRLVYWPERKTDTQLQALTL